MCGQTGGAMREKTTARIDHPLTGQPPELLNGRRPKAQEDRPG